jgi:hypothetical protein
VSFGNAIGGFTASLVYAFLLTTSGTPSSAREYHLNMSGFGDVLYSAPRDSADVPFSIGQIELDVSSKLSERIEVSAAVAYDRESGSFGSGAFFAEFLLFGTDGGHFRPILGINHSGIIAGQFDVPFGLDWEVYASIDRKLTSVPLVVENTHHRWNDIGVQAHFNTGVVHGVVYGVNGFSESAVKMQYARGGRLGLRPIPFLEFGGSLAGFVRPGGETDMRLAGVDTRMRFGPLTLTGEYITRKRGLSEGPEFTDYGYYAEGLLSAGRGFLVSRYDSYTSGDAGTGRESRTCLGAGWALREGCETRLEHQFQPNRDDATFLQVAVAF